MNFGSAFYGTDKVVPVILFNNGPDPVNFISVLDEGAEGEEAVSYGHKRDFVTQNNRLRQA